MSEYAQAAIAIAIVVAWPFLMRRLVTWMVARMDKE